MTLAIGGLRKAFGQIVALGGVDLEVASGEFLAVLGPSGSGKTTLLRCIAGLEMPDEGRIEIDGRDLAEVPAGDRDIAMVFQDLALFPHLTAAENIGFGLRARNAPEVSEKVGWAGRKLGITDALDRRPHELSGGERQRVALGRALVREPALFLMDEPLSNLDAELRTHTRTDIKALQRDLGTATVYVTHDQVEAMTLGDRVAVIRDGRIDQIATPVELYDRPETSFVAGFIGNPGMNLFPGDLLGAADPGELLGIRPEKLRIVAGDEGRFAGSVTAVEPVGADAIVRVDVSGIRFVVRTDRESTPVEGAQVWLTFEDGDVYRFDRSGRPGP